ncbi:hypothetical protein B6V74_05110 [Thioclava sp. F42-5]|nr:hypothetical protein B6V74_05110 [Thioclava sp. F42-5]
MDAAQAREVERAQGDFLLPSAKGSGDIWKTVSLRVFVATPCLCSNGPARSDVAAERDCIGDVLGSAPFLRLGILQPLSALLHRSAIQPFKKPTYSLSYS